MSDDTYADVCAHIAAHTLHPEHMLGPASRLDLIVDREQPDDQPILTPRSITLSPGDLTDLRRRIEAPIIFNGGEG